MSEISEISENDITEGKEEISYGRKPDPEVPPKDWRPDPNLLTEGFKKLPKELTAQVQQAGQEEPTPISSEQAARERQARAWGVSTQVVESLYKTLSAAGKASPSSQGQGEKVVNNPAPKQSNPK